MEKDEKQRILEESFLSLRHKGVIRTYKDFAKVLDVGPTSLSAAKNGNETYLTDNLISKVLTLMKDYEDKSQVQIVLGDNNSGDVTQNARTCPSIQDLMARVTELEAQLAAKEQETSWLRSLVEKVLNKNEK